MTRAARLGPALAGFVAFINLYTPQAILPAIGGDFVAGPGTMGLAITATLAATALAAPFVGAMSDRWGRKRLIVAASFLLALPTLLIAAAPNLTALIGLRFAQGLMLPFIFTVAVGYVGDEFEGPDAVRAAGAYAMGTIAGGFLGRFAAGIVAEWAGWRAGFLAIGLATLVLTVAVAFLLPRERRFRPAAATWATWRQHAGNPRLMATCLVGAGMLFCMVATFTYTNFRLAAAPFVLSPAKQGWVFVVYLLGLVTTPIGTLLTLRLGRRSTLAACLACAGLGLALTLGETLPSIIAGLALLSGGLFVVQTLSLGWIAATIRTARATATGLYVTSYYIGGAFGAVLPARLWHDAGWPGVALPIAVAIGSIMALGGMAWRPAPVSGP